MCRDAFRMRVLVYDPHIASDVVLSLGAVPVDDLLDLAGEVDILSIHTPLLSSTRHLIGRDVIAAIKPGAILVNTARGPVVDEEALVEGLRSGKLGGAGIDVYDPQPPSPDNPLLQMDQVVLTPHVASFTQEGRLRMGLTVVEDVLRVLRGQQPHYPANPEVLPVAAHPVG
jgi:phosphoglycerate dehydrogenase-like enzyme